MNLRKFLPVIILSVVLAAQATAQSPITQSAMSQHDCLGATSAAPVSILSGASATGNTVSPLGASHDLSGFLTFSGAGTVTVTVQTRKAGSTVWHTPTQGATSLTAASAGSHHFLIAVPVCEALRLVYTAAGATASVTEAFVIDQHE